MASKNSVKTYSENGYYHIYNRGVEKRKIFNEEQDYGVFLSYLKEYLMPKDEKHLREILADPMTTWRDKDKVLKALHLNNFNIATPGHVLLTQSHLRREFLSRKSLGEFYF